MIQVTNLSFSHLRPIFKNISFNVGNNQIVGLTGPNGAGKSTLFKLLKGDEKPKEGSIIIDGTIMLVPQEIKHDPALEESNTVREYLDKDFVEEDQKILSMLQGLELRNVDLYSSAKNLSGGQKTKLAIIRALLKEPDILLLDEPTNFLDTKGKFWVASFLSKYPKTLILVSHDLALLDKSINKVIAINPETASIEEYKGNYSQYIKVKSQKDAHLVRQVTNTQKHIKRMEKSLAGLMGRKSEKGVRQRVQLQKRIQRIKESLPPLPATARGFRMEIPQPKKVSQIPIKLNNISKRFGELTIFENFSVTIEKGDRIAVIGHNGAGKSTLLKMLVEKLAPDQGEIVRAENLKIGYYTQELEALDFQKDLFEMVESIKMLPHERIRSHLASFCFTGNKVFQKVGSLSGGEKTRLSIALLLLEDYNMLVLDEPTTYLDVLSQRIILEAIKKYKGTLVIVSHTEDFVEELRPTKAIIMPDQKVKFWENELLERVSYI